MSVTTESLLLWCTPPFFLGVDRDENPDTDGLNLATLEAHSEADVTPESLLYGAHSPFSQAERGTKP